MLNNLPTDKFSLKKRNIEKYGGVQPSWDLVLSIIKKSGLKTRMRFQRVWGIPGQVLNQYKFGERDIPAQYWHIFYEFDEMSDILKKKMKSRKSETLNINHKKKSTKKVLNQKLIDDQIKF